uniref:Uncharacterized protein n=1 Tax=Anguilla anguilla TaxID=7936 RepID=A0A0E9W6W7_ANGAN
MKTLGFFITINTNTLHATEIRTQTYLPPPSPPIEWGCILIGRRALCPSTASPLI